MKQLFSRLCAKTGPKTSPRNPPRKPSVVEVTVENPATDIPPLLYWAESRHILRIHLPVELLRMQGAFAYAGGWHPFIAALNDGPSALEWFYTRFQPQTLADFYFFEAENLAGETLPPWELPWLLRKDRKPPPGEGGLGPEHGVSYYGPATPEKIALEFERLRSTADNIRQNGYLPDTHGDIAGYFMRIGETYRFFVKGGKHRSAALAYLGHKTIPVTLRTTFPRLIDLSTTPEWPLVHGGQMAPELAERILKRYMEWDGSQQLSLLNRR